MCKQESSKSTGVHVAGSVWMTLVSNSVSCLLTLKKVIMEGGVVIHPYLKFGGRGCNLSFFYYHR